MPRKPPEHVVVITGASNGPGRAVALEFALHNDALVLGSRREGPLEAVRRDCEALNAWTLAHATEISNEASAFELANAALARFKRVDVWINYAPPMPLLRGDVMPAEAFADAAAFDLSGYVNGATAALAVFKALGRGVLINVDSLVGGSPPGCESAFAEVRRRMHVTFREIEERARAIPGVHVTSIMPPRTPMASETLAPMIVGLATAQAKSGLLGTVLGRLERERFRAWSRIVPPHRRGARPEVLVDPRRSGESEAAAESWRSTATSREGEHREHDGNEPRRSMRDRTGSPVLEREPERTRQRTRQRTDSGRHGSWRLSSVATTRENVSTIALLVGVPAIVLAGTLLLVR